MKKRSLLVYSLLLGSLITPSATSCGDSEVGDLINNEYTVVVNYDINGGAVVVDKASGVVEEDSVVTVTIRTNTGYHIEAIETNGVSQDTNKTNFTFKPQVGRNTVNVTFAKDNDTQNLYTISLKGTLGGEVNVDKTSGNVGETVNITVTPEENYELSKLVINGVEQSLDVRKFSPVKGENIIEYAFKLIESEPVVETYTIKVESSENGSVSVDKTSGNVGETVNLTITPNSGYRTSEILINNVSVALTTTSFKPIKGENTVKILFEEIPQEPVVDTYTINVENTEHGTVSADKASGNVGETVNITVVPENGYEISELIINDLSVLLTTTSFKPVKGINTIKAIFKEIPNIPVVDTYSIKVENNGHGTINVDKTSGNVGESVNLTITPDNGYRTSEILINNASVALTTTSFKPVKGENTVKVIFEEIPQEPVVDTYSIQVISNEGGRVSVDKTSGNVGDKVRIDIEIDDGYELSSIKINGEEKDLYIISFEPVKGNNVIEVTFTKLIPAVDQGIEFTGFDYPNKTDFVNEDAFYDYVIENIKPYFSTLDDQDVVNNTIESFKALDMYNSFAVRYGLTKSVLDNIFNNLINEDFINVINRNEISDITKDECLVLANFVENCINSIELPQFAGLTGFLSLGAIVGLSTNGNATKMMMYNLAQNINGAKTYYADDASISYYVNAISLNSDFNYKESINEYLKLTDIISEVIYKVGKNLTDMKENSESKYGADKLSELIYNILTRFTNSSSFGTSEALTNETLLNIFDFIYDVFYNSMFSKESFFKICDKLAEINDPIDTLLQLLPNNNEYYKLSFASAFKLLKENKETAYYLIKLIGSMSHRIDEEWINEIVSIQASLKLSDEEKAAQTFAYIGQIYKSGLSSLTFGNTVDVETLIKNSGLFLTQFKEILFNGDLDGVTEENCLDTETIFTTLKEAGNLDPNNLSDDDITRFNNVLTLLKDFLTKLDKPIDKYSISFDTTYKVGSELSLKVSDESSLDLTDKCVVEGFDTTTIGYKLAKITLPNKMVTYHPYYVTYSGEYVETDTYVYSLNSTPAYNIKLRIYNYQNNTYKTVYLKDSGYEYGVVDTSTTGTKYLWIKNTSGDYFFVKYMVK